MTEMAEGGCPPFLPAGQAVPAAAWKAGTKSEAGPELPGGAGLRAALGWNLWRGVTLSALLAALRDDLAGVRQRIRNAAAIGYSPEQVERLKTMEAETLERIARTSLLLRTVTSNSARLRSRLGLPPVAPAPSRRLRLVGGTAL